MHIRDLGVGGGGGQGLSLNQIFTINTQESFGCGKNFGKNCSYSNFRVN